MVDSCVGHLKDSTLVFDEAMFNVGFNVMILFTNSTCHARATNYKRVSTNGIESICIDYLCLPIVHVAQFIVMTLFTSLGVSWFCKCCVLSVSNN